MSLNDCRTKRNKDKKKIKEIDDDLKAEELNCFQNYSVKIMNNLQLSIIEPTIEEREKEDEINLLGAIENLNKRKLKNRPERNFDTFSYLENFNSDLQILISNEALQLKNQDSSSKEEISKDFLNLKISLSKNSTEDNTFSFENSQIEAIVSQNFINFEHIFKLIVIGDKAVGKTLFVDRFVSDRNPKKQENKSYVPTEWYLIKKLIYINSLEIKKTFLKILGINSKIELWDTNLSITNSPIINSKQIKFN